MDTSLDSTPVADSIDRLLDWPEAALPTVATILGLRRHWMGPLFARLRREYEAATGEAPPVSQAAAFPVVQALPSAAYFQWLHRHIQEMTWAACGRVVADRLPAIEAALAPRPDDLGSLAADPGFAHPGYYLFDFHRQAGGIWRDTAGAAVYLLGARLVHVGRNTDFQLHDKFVADLGLTTAPARVLDLGCGFGKTTFSLARAWPEAEVTGLDVAEPCLRLGRRMATERGLAILWRQAAIEALPEPDDSADLVTCTMVLHEMPEAAIAASFREAFRVLKPGGLFVTLENRLLGDPFRDVLLAWYSQLIDEPYWEPFRHLDLPRMARQAGFSTAELQPWHPPGADPAADTDPRRWATPWGLMIARKG